MRTTSTALLLVAMFAVGGCSASSPSGPGSAPPPEPGGPAGVDGAGAEEEEVTEYTYAANEQITVDLTMHTNSEGGRLTPFFSGYRPTIEFESQDQSAECTTQLPVELSEFAPGETHMVVLECDTEITVHVDTPGFTLLETGTEHGSGEVVFTEEGQ